MQRHLVSIGAALAAFALAPLAHASPEAKPVTRASNCFASNHWESWTAGPSGDTLYLRVNLKDYYQVDLTPGSHVVKRGNEFLVNHVRGSSWICSALDLDLQLSDNLGFRQPLIARSMRKMTAEEVAALPKKYRP
jgi:hypothetical protein